MPVMTATKINKKWHFPGIIYQTLCGLSVEGWELIGSGNPVDLKDVCEECHKIAMSKPIIIISVEPKLH